MLPELGQDVVLEVAGIGPLPVSVQRLGDDGLLLALPDGDMTAIPVVTASEAIVAYATVRGMYRVRGTLRPSAPRQTSLRFDMGDRPKLLQRRDNVRIAAVLPVTLHPPKGEAIRTQTVDLSGSGMRVVDSARLWPDETVGVSLALRDGSARVPMSATVVREVDANSKALRIDHVSHAERERLIRVVFERQRTALRRARGS